jgi:hypothetical protein
MSQSRFFPHPPSSAEQLDAYMHHIDVGDGELASLSDEEREQLRTELAEAWLADYLDAYPVPSDLEAAAAQYRAIASGEWFPHLPEHVREDLLIQFNTVHGEGGPEHWKWQE